MAFYIEMLGYGTVKAPGNTGDIFTSMTPETPDAVISVIEYGGEPPKFVHNRRGISTSMPRVQINVRDSVPETARARSAAICGELAKLVNTPVGSGHYRRIMPLQTPFQRERDENDRFTYTFNVSVEKAGL